MLAIASTTTTGTTTATMIVVEFDVELPDVDELASAEVVAPAGADDEVAALAVEDDEVAALFHSVGMNWDWIPVGSIEFKVVRFTRSVGTGARNVDIPMLELEISQVDAFEHCQNSIPVLSGHGTLGSYTTRSQLPRSEISFHIQSADGNSDCTPQRCRSGRCTTTHSIARNPRPVCFCRKSSRDRCRQPRNSSLPYHCRRGRQVRRDWHDRRVVVRSSRTILRAWRWAGALWSQKPPVPCSWPKRVSQRV